jgi:NAD+ synthase
MINNIEEEVKKITEWIKKYVDETNANGIVIGNSGGKDSATVTALATKAIGKEKIITVGMPCSSIKADLEDAKLVASTFQVPIIEVDLKDTYNTLENAITNKLKSNNIANEISLEGKINMKPRLRMITLYSIAKTLNYLVIGTGNASEGFVGYTTKWGDSASDFNPIANYTVPEVLQIGKYLGVPDKIINKAPNDGLRNRYG